MNTDLSLASWIPLQQQRLLRTLCVNRNAAGAAFIAWNLETDWGGHFDRGSFRLLPAAYKHIESLGIDDPVLGRLRGIYRRSWVRNQRYLGTWIKLHDVLAGKGIDALLLGGAGLATGYYRNFGARYVTGTDLLVRPLQAVDAFTAMRGAGWLFEVLEIDLLDDRRSVSFHDPLGEPGTLRWQPSRSWTPDSLDWFWGSAVPAHPDGLSMSVPGPAAMLLYQLAEMREQEAWTIAVLLADLNTIMQHANFDWEQLLAEARAQQLMYTLALAIGCLQTDFGVSVPAPVLQQLDSTSSTLCERLELRLYSQMQRDQETFLCPVVALSARYLRFISGRTVADILMLSPGFLRRYYGSKSLLQILTRLLRNGLRRGVRLVARRLQRTPQPVTGAGN